MCISSFSVFALHSFFQSFGISLVFQGLLEISNDQQSETFSFTAYPAGLNCLALLTSFKHLPQLLLECKWFCCHSGI